MNHTRDQGRPTRRQTIKGAVLGAAGLSLLGPGALRAWAAPKDPPKGAGRTPKARAVIEIWMSGGPCHVDTFDPKPAAGNAIAGPLLTPAPTNVDGILIGELLPNLAKQADKYSLIRSFGHGNDGHETATYLVQTGRKPGEDDLVYPGFGAVVTSFKGYDGGYQGMIPPYVVLTTPLGRFSEVGFLGLKNKPFVTGGDPRAARFAVDGIIAEGISDERQVRRRDLLHALDSLGRAIPDNPSFKKLDACEAKAYDLMLGDAGKVFDLNQEKADLRERYGRTHFGQSCLAARRLVEGGVPYVTVHNGGWDTHKRHFEAMRGKLSEFDRGLSSLLADLADRGLLDSTIVWCTGEFGRTPRVQWEEPWNGGRGHFGRVFSVLVAGGGFKGGRVVGSTDPTGENAASRPVKPIDLMGTMYELLGIDPDGPLPNPKGLDVRVLPPSEQGAGKGRLRELV